MALISSAASRGAGSGNWAIVAATRMPLQRDRTGIGGRGRQEGLYRYRVQGVDPSKSGYTLTMALNFSD
jgi:hypothetical protein